MSTWDAPESDGMAGVAERLGMTYAGTTANRGYQEDVGEEGPPPIDILRETNAYLEDLVYGRYEGCNAQIFHFTLASYEPEPTAVKRSCVVLSFASDFPHLSIAPHTRMSQLSIRSNRRWLKFAPENFRNTFHVEAPSNEVAQQFLSPPLMTYLLASRPDLRLTLEGGALVAHVRRLADDEWDDFLRLVVGVQSRLPAEVWAEYSSFGF